MAFPGLVPRALGIAHLSPFGKGGCLAFHTPLELLVFSDQGLVASSQLGHLLLQRHDLTLY